MHHFFLIVHVLAAVGLVGLVLLQQGRGADAGAAFGSGASGTLFGARGPASFLTRVTAILAAVFFLTSLGLAYMVSHSDRRESVLERLQDTGAGGIPGEETSIPSIPSVPGPDGSGPSDVPGEPGRDIPAAPATDAAADAAPADGLEAVISPDEAGKSGTKPVVPGNPEDVKKQ